MTCPSRKNLMICKIIQDKRSKKEENKTKEKITEEEHQKRLKKLKELGLI